MICASTLIDHREGGERHDEFVGEIEEAEEELKEAFDELKELEEEGQGNSEAAHDLRKEIRSLVRRLGPLQERQAMEDLHRHNLVEHEAHLQTLETHRRELADHQRALTEHRRLQAELREPEDKNPEKAAQVREELKRVEMELAQLKQVRRQLRQTNPSSQPEPGPEDLRQRHAELEVKAESLHRALEAIGDQNDDLTERLERALHEILVQMEEIERAAHDRPEPKRRDLEAKVHRLNEKVENLSVEMREIRGLLERLVVQLRENVVEREVEVRRGSRRDSAWSMPPVRRVNESDKDGDAKKDDKDEGRHNDN